MRFRQWRWGEGERPDLVEAGRAFSIRVPGAKSRGMKGIDAPGFWQDRPDWTWPNRLEGYDVQVVRLSSARTGPEFRFDRSSLARIANGHFEDRLAL